MNVHLVTIGQEILIGDIINTNAAWIGQFLTGMGMRLQKVTSVGDEKSIIIKTLSTALEESDVVITTGGLGPTHDDVTKAAICELLKLPLRKDEAVFEHVKSIFERRKMPFSVSNHAQAMVPETAEVLFNREGTAPGLWIPVQHKALVVLPGVPHEMKYLMQEKVTPKILDFNKEVDYYKVHYFQTAGVGESTMSDIVLQGITEKLSDSLTLAFLPTLHGLTLRVSSFGTSKTEVETQCEHVVNDIRERAGEFIFSEKEHQQLNEVVGLLLREQHKTISVAESCTGGMILSSLTDVPGSSTYLKGGIVAYDNAVKVAELGVSQADLDIHGAVSKHVALQMAKGVAQRLGTSIGIATTGVAGPGGGTEEKPVGTIWFGFWSEQKHFAFTLLLTKNREVNRQRSTLVALDMLRRELSGIGRLPYDAARETA